MHGCFGLVDSQKDLIQFALYYFQGGSGGGNFASTARLLRNLKRGIST